VSTTITQELTMEQRSDILARTVSQQVRQGWRVVSQTQTQAQLVKGKPTNHILHLILSLITLGVWVIVWIAMVIFGGEKQKFISVTETGQIL
jgi:hypothetical protein